MPESILTIERSGPVLRIRYPWRRVGLLPDRVMLAFVGVFLFGLLGPRAFPFLEGPCALMAITSATYVVAVHLLNTTTISVSLEEIHIRSGPLPWRQSLRIRDRKPVYLLAQPAAKFAYEHGVKVYFNDGSRAMLVPEGLPRWEAAQVERLVEAHLNLTHMATPECPRCSYDLRGTADHCPECGWKSSGGR